MTHGFIHLIIPLCGKPFTKERRTKSKGVFFMPTATKAAGAKKADAAKKSSATRTRRASNVAYIFFNCDAEKSQESMNIFYNHEIYRDTQASRKALWQKIKAEQDAERIHISEDDLTSVRTAILENDPAEASQYMRFGAIEVVACH